MHMLKKGCGGGSGVMPLSLALMWLSSPGVSLLSFFLRLVSLFFFWPRQSPSFIASLLTLTFNSSNGQIRRADGGQMGRRRISAQAFCSVNQKTATSVRGKRPQKADGVGKFWYAKREEAEEKRGERSDLFTGSHSHPPPLPSSSAPWFHSSLRKGRGKTMKGGSLTSRLEGHSSVR